MAETKDEKDQVVTGQGVEAQVASEQGAEGQVASGNESPVDGQQAQDGPVPYSRFKEVNDAKKVAEEAQKEAEAQTQLVRDQMALQSANQVQTQVQTQTRAKSTYEQAIADCGITEVEYMTEPDRIRIMARKDELDSVKVQQQANVMTNQTFINDHSDYGEVVGRYNQTGVFVPSAELTKILQEKPYLTAAAYASSRGAYNVVVKERELQEIIKKNKVFEQHQAGLNADNKLAPLAGSAAGGAGTHDDMSGLKTADDVAAMEARVAAGEFDK